jgi:hypothetical protein
LSRIITECHGITSEKYRKNGILQLLRNVM